MRKLLVFALLGLSIGLGLIMENQKVAVNFLLEYGARFPEFFSLDVSAKSEQLAAWKSARVADYFFAHHTPAWLLDLNYAELVRVKWAIAILAILLFSTLNLTILHLAFGRKEITRLAAYFLAGILALCVLIFVTAYLFPSLPGLYAVSRELLGGLQSPVPLMILAPAAWLYIQSKSDKNE